MLDTVTIANVSAKVAIRHHDLHIHVGKEGAGCCIVLLLYNQIALSRLRKIAIRRTVLQESTKPLTNALQHPTAGRIICIP